MIKNIYIYMCVCVCIYMCVYIYIYVYIYVCMYVCIPNRILLAHLMRGYWPAYISQVVRLDPNEMPLLLFSLFLY
jgi:hypothetical protein